MLTSPRFDKPVRPIFVIGAPRSGTSITTWILGQHPNIQPMPETSWIASMAVGSHLSYAYGSGRDRFSHLSNVRFERPPFMRRVGEAIDAIVHDCYEERCRRLYGDFRANGKLAASEDDGDFQIRRSVDDPKQRWIDATPFNTFFVPALSEMFPEARFIHNLRAPAAVATSLEGFDKFGHAPLQLEEGLRTWASHTECAWLAERAFGKERVFRLAFDRIGNDTEALVHDLCRFLDEPFHPDCLLPTATRINSSEVDARQEANLAQLCQSDTFLACEGLFRDIEARPPSDAPAADAMEELQARFLEYCRHHPLI